MIEFVEKMVQIFEEYLKTRSNSIQDSCSMDIYYLIKVIDHKKDQYTVFEAFETDVSETFEVRARNTFESFCKPLLTLSFQGNRLQTP